MRFWDSSALVPTLISEESSSEMRRLLADDPRTAVWWATPVECLAAIARRERSGELDPPEVGHALASLADLADGWLEVPPSETVREVARRLVRVHEVGTADAFQIAAAATLGEQRVDTVPVVTLDERLAAAARREGFPVVPG